MSDFYEIDFLQVETKKSGDAIAIRYQIGDDTYIHVVDGGFEETGKKLKDFLNKYYGNDCFIDHVVVTHSDGDHTNGLKTILNECQVGALWMLRPWLYADDLITRFSRYSSVDNLKKRLRECYPTIDSLESIAEEKEIPIYEPFQGVGIGAFTVLSPSRESYLDLIVDSDKTPAESGDSKQADRAGFFRKVINFVKKVWGAEDFPADGTSAENEMSIVQYAELCEKKILLTGDAGRIALSSAVSYLTSKEVNLPGLNFFQVPHHGSRHNVSSELLDALLGPKLSTQPSEDKLTFTAFISAAKADEDHPRKSVVRSVWHRGGRPITTENGNKWSYHNAPPRAEYSPVSPMPYPEDEEEV